MSDKSGLLDKIETNSSLFEKISPDFRRQIDEAIVDRSPPTYRAIYEHFCLPDFAISFSAFYRYARRLRFHAAAFDQAELAMPEGADLIDLLPQLLAHRLLEAVIDEAASARTIQRLAEAWRITAGTRLTLGRHAAELDNLQKKELAKENDRLLAIANQCTKYLANDLRAQTVAAKNLLASANDTNQTNRPPPSEPQP